MKNITVSKRIDKARLVLCLILAAWYTSGCATIGFNTWSDSTIRNGDYDEIQRLIEDGANVNAWLRLHYRKTKPLIVAASYGHTEIVKLFIGEGADVNAATKKRGPPPTDTDYGWTALMAATSGGYLEIVRVLLEAGADVNLISTPMHSTESSPNW